MGANLFAEYALFILVSYFYGSLFFNCRSLDFLGFWVVFLQFVIDFVVDSVIEKQTHSQNMIAFLCFLMLFSSFQLVICIGYFSLIPVLFLSGVLGHVCLICG